MNVLVFLKYFVATVISVFLLDLIITYLYNLVFTGFARFDWERAAHLALVLGLVVPFWYMRNQALQKR